MPSSTTGDPPKVNGHHDDAADDYIFAQSPAGEEHGTTPTGGRDAEPQRSALHADMLLTSDLRDPVELDRGARREAWRAAAAPYLVMHGSDGLLRGAELLHGKVRAGVAQHELLREITTDAQLVASREAQVGAEQAGGVAAAREADLLANAPEGLPSLEANLQDCVEKQPTLEQNSNDAEEKYLKVLEQAQGTGELTSTAPVPTGNKSVLALVMPSEGLAALVGVIDAAAAIALFSLCLTGVIDFNSEWMALAVAAVIGAGFQGSMLVLGKALAALALGVRRTAALLIVGYGVALVVLFPNLDALRAEDTKGLVAFTALNALGGLSTAFISYWTLVHQADAAHRQHTAESEQPAVVYPTALALAKQQLDASMTAKKSNDERIVELNQKVTELRQAVLDTRVYAVHDVQRIADINAKAKEAGARTTLAIERATTRVEQERHAAQARASDAAAAGVLARCQKDEPPQSSLENQISGGPAADTHASPPAVSERLRRALWTTTGLIVAAAIAFIAGAPQVAGVGALLAGLALVLGLLADLRSSRTAPSAAPAPDGLAPTQITDFQDARQERPFIYPPDHYRA